MLNLLRKKKGGLNNPLTKAFSMPRLHHHSSSKIDEAHENIEDNHYIDNNVHRNPFQK